jgi:transposase InsO family protein
MRRHLCQTAWGERLDSADAHKVEWECDRLNPKPVRHQNRTSAPRKIRRRRVARYSEPLAHCDGPNRVWCADFKGWFLTGDGLRCDPLTIGDGFSRYRLCCQALARPTYEAVRSLFEATFREYRLPLAMRTDNGTPLGSTRGLGLSRLSIWWIKLGITPERIAPGKPQQNGRHERIHRTLKGRGFEIVFYHRIRIHTRRRILCRRRTRSHPIAIRGMCGRTLSPNKSNERFGF